MTPAERQIAQLDRNIAAKGELVRLQRVVGTTPQSIFSAEMRAWVRPYGTKEIIAGSGIVMGDYLVVLSPTGILAAQWPGGQSQGQIVAGDIHVPKANQDRIVIQGRTRAIKAVNPRYVGGTLVRIDLQVAG
jgi:hypothetical protein